MDYLMMLIVISVQNIPNIVNFIFNTDHQLSIFNHLYISR